MGKVDIRCSSYLTQIPYESPGWLHTPQCKVECRYGYSVVQADSAAGSSPFSTCAVKVTPCAVSLVARVVEAKA